MWQEQQGGTQAPLSLSLMFLLHFDVFCDLLLYRPTIPRKNSASGDVIYRSILQ